METAILVDEVAWDQGTSWVQPATKFWSRAVLEGSGPGERDQGGITVPSGSVKLRHRLMSTNSSCLTQQLTVVGVTFAAIAVNCNGIGYTHGHSSATYRDS